MHALRAFYCHESKPRTEGFFKLCPGFNCTISKHENGRKIALCCDTGQPITTVTS